MKKDSKMTGEQRRRVSEAQRKRFSNPEERRKVSEFHKGRRSSSKTKFKKGMVPWNKGKSPSEETKRKIGLAGKGRKQSEETIRKRVLALTGQTRSEEVRRKISLARTGIYLSEESKRKMSEAHKGIHNSPRTEFKKGMTPWSKGKTGVFSPERLKEMSEFQKKRMSDPEVRKRMSDVHKGRRPSEETVRKRSQALKGHEYWGKGFVTEETKLKISLATKGKKLAETTKKKISEIMQGKHHSPRTEFKKGYIVSEEMRELSRKNILKMYESGTFPKQTHTVPERKVKEELIKRGYVEGIDFVHQYKFMNKFMCDFCFPQNKVIVEVYGDFWHANPNRYPEGSVLHTHQIKGKRVDKSKEAYITKVDNHAWTYLTLWESDIKKDVSKWVDKIEEVLTEKK